MTRPTSTPGGWRDLTSDPRRERGAGPALGIAEIRGHRAEQASLVRRQIERIEAERRTTAQLTMGLLAVDAVLIGAGAVARALPPGGWLTWPLLLLAVISFGLIGLSAVIAAIGLWRREAGAAGPAGMPLVTPGRTAVLFPDAASLQARLLETTENELQRQEAAEWLRLARSARGQGRALLWATGLMIAGLLVIAGVALIPPH